MQGAQGAQCLLSVLLSRAKDVVVHKRKRSKNPDLLVEREVGLKGKRVECPAGDLWCRSTVWQMRSENPAALLRINSFFTGFGPSEPHCTTWSWATLFREKSSAGRFTHFLTPSFPFPSLIICKEIGLRGNGECLKLA